MADQTEAVETATKAVADALATHTDLGPHTCTAYAALAVAALRGLDTPTRMAAMAMRKAVWDDIDTDLRSPVWVEADD